MGTQQSSNPDNNVAIYVRPTAAYKLGRRTHPSLDDLFTLTLSMGWRDEQITVIDEQGIAGKAPSDNQPGITALLESIQQDNIRTIVVSERLKTHHNSASL